MIENNDSFIYRRYLTVGVLLPLFIASGVWANVQGGNVIYGQAEIQQTSPERVDILQSSHKAVIQWNSFDIGLDETVHFEQPSAQSLALNRILDHDASTILGHLSATGRIFLINPNGILFGENARVDVSGLLATTIDISDEDFENGRYDFSTSGRPNSYVINQGSITAREGGMVAMVAPWVRNEGIINAFLGQVSLVSAETFTLDMYGDGLVQIAVDDEPAAPLIDPTGQPVTSLVENAGTISAEGGHVFMTARSAGAFVDRAIDMSGIIEATSLVEKNGEIVLQGHDEGDVRVTGTLDTSATGAGATGGIVKILGERVGLFQDAVVDVSGDEGGGQAFIGGAYQGSDELRSAEQTQVGPNAQINANAGQAGDGGQVVVWADNTTHYYGNISARGGDQSGNGGQVEVSGKENLNFFGSVDTSAPNGNFGELLLDPTDGAIVVVGDAETTDLTAVDEFADPDLGGDDDAKISVDSINNAAANVEVRVSRDLTVATEVDMQNANVGISLIAQRNLNVNKAIFTNGGDVLLHSDADNNGSGTTRLDIDSLGGSRIQTGGGNVTFTGLVELLRDTTVNSLGGDITFEDNITGNFQLYLRTPINGDITLKGDTDIGDFLIDGFGNFVNEGTLQAGDIRLYGGTVSMDVGFNTATADGEGGANGDIDVSPNALINLIGALTAAGNITVGGISTINVILNIVGGAMIEAQNGIVDGTVGGASMVTDTNGGGDLNDSVNDGPVPGNGNNTDIAAVLNPIERPDPFGVYASGDETDDIAVIFNDSNDIASSGEPDDSPPGNTTIAAVVSKNLESDGSSDNLDDIPPATDIEEIINQTENLLSETPGMPMSGDPNSANLGGGHAARPLNIPSFMASGNGRVAVFDNDGNLLGEISEGGSGIDLIVAMQNAGYKPDQIANVFIQAADLDVTCQDVTVNYGTNIEYIIGDAIITLSTNGAMMVTNGNLVVIYNSDGSVTRLNIRSPNQKMITSYPDGTISVKDGNTGYETIKKPDGTVIVKYLSGETVTTTPDGTKTKIYIDDNGASVKEVTQGNTTTTTWSESDGSGNTVSHKETTVKHNDGSKSETVWMNGKVSKTTETSANGKKVTVGTFDSNGNLTATNTTIKTDNGVVTETHSVTGGATTVTQKDGPVTTQTVTDVHGKKITTTLNDAPERYNWIESQTEALSNGNTVERERWSEKVDGGSDIIYSIYNTTYVSERIIDSNGNIISYRQQNTDSDGYPNWWGKSKSLLTEPFASSSQ